MKTLSPADSDAPTPVPLQDVERELAKRFQALAGPGKGPVIRARLSNLVIVCRTEERARQISEEIPAVAAVHPARFILLVDTPSATAFTASVGVRTQEVAPEKRVCIEQITLRAHGADLEQFPYAVRELVIGDLPINLWWAIAEPPPLAGPLVYELKEHTQQIIYDSIGWTDPPRGVVAAASWLAQIDSECARGPWRVVSDLNWRRLKYWRRLVAQALAPGTFAGGPESIREVHVEHGPHAVIQAWELVSWLAARLGWRVDAGSVETGVQLAWKFASTTGDVDVSIRRLGEGLSEIKRLRIVCPAGEKSVTLNFAAESPERLAASVEGAGDDAAARTITVPPQSLADLLGRQLSDRERDPIFYQSMAVARVLAQSILEK